MRAFITLIDASGHVLVENKEIEPSYTETVYNPKGLTIRARQVGSNGRSLCRGVLDKAYF